MTTYTITAPDGKDYSMDGPAGATQQQVIEQISKNLPSSAVPGPQGIPQWDQRGPQGIPSGTTHPAPQIGIPSGPQNQRNTAQPDQVAPSAQEPTSLWEKALSQLPPEIQKQAASLVPNWNHNTSAYSPYKPAQPGQMPNDAINPVGTDAQMGAGIAATGAALVGSKMLARAEAGAPPGPIPPPASPVAPAGPPTVPQIGGMVKPGPTQGPWGTAPAPAPVIRGPGGRFQPNPEAQPQPAPAATPYPASAPVPQAPPPAPAGPGAGQMAGLLGEGLSHFVPGGHAIRSVINLLGRQ